jgi:hypothetical protein
LETDATALELETDVAVLKLETDVPQETSKHERYSANLEGCHKLETSVADLELETDATALELETDVAGLKLETDVPQETSKHERYLAN